MNSERRIAAEGDDISALVEQYFDQSAGDDLELTIVSIW